MELEEEEDTPEGHEQGSPIQVKGREHWVQMWILDGISLEVFFLPRSSGSLRLTVKGKDFC
jgi:hypothetical protein